MAYVPVKVYRKNEIRRFLLEQGENNHFSFKALLNQIQQVFPNLTTTAARVTWKDSDGESIVMSSDLELMDAVRSLPANDQMLRLQLVDDEQTTITNEGSGATPTAAAIEEPEVVFIEDEEEEPMDDGQHEKRQRDPPKHRRVYCDGCQSDIRGIRYKCLVCPDYDLCSGCVEKSTHDEHVMIRIMSPKDKSWKPAFIAAQAPFSFGGGPFGRHHHGGRGHHHGPQGHHGPHRYPHVHHHERYGPFGFPGAPAPPTNAPAADQSAPSAGPAGPHPSPMGPWSMYPRMFPFGFEGWRGRGGMRGMRGGCMRGGRPCQRPEEKTPDQTTTTTNAAEMETDRQEQPKRFNPQEFARDVTETLSSALAAFGIPVTTQDGATNPKPQETPIAPPTAEAAAAAPVHPDPKIAAALNYMLAMGYTNEGGWLSQLLEEKRGDVSAVLDVMHLTK